MSEVNPHPSDRDTQPHSIREFHYPQDYAAIVELWRQAGPGIHVRRSDEPGEIAKKLQRDPDLFLIAEMNGEIIGSVIGGFDGRRGMVYHLAISHPFRHQGIASSLMDELESRMRMKGCLRTYLLVTKDNQPAMHFYETHGWEQMDILVYGKNLA